MKRFTRAVSTDSHHPPALRRGERRGKPRRQGEEGGGQRRAHGTGFPLHLTLPVVAVAMCGGGLVRREPQVEGGPADHRRAPLAMDAVVVCRPDGTTLRQWAAPHIVAITQLCGALSWRDRG